MINFNKVQQPFLVAEIGNNHEGSLKNAILLVKEAKKAGADAVKFQIFNPVKFTSQKDKKRISQLKKFTLKRKDIIKLKKKCDELKIIFFATPLDIESAEFLNKIQNIFKISSGDNNYLDLLRKVRSFKKPTIISTGLMNSSEIVKVVQYFQKFNFYKKKENLCIMHCVSSYPATKKKINLSSITYLIKKFPNVTIGYSDHTMGKKIPTLSFVLGARVIEKHFTLSNNFSDFRDHKISLNPNLFKSFVNEVNDLKIILGKLNKNINDEEKKNQNLMRRKLIMSKKMKKGEVLKKKNLLQVRSSEDGIFATEIRKILGKRIKKNIRKFQNLLTKDIY